MFCFLFFCFCSFGAPERQKGLKSIRKGAQKRKKDLKEQKQKNKKQNKGPPRKKCKTTVFLAENCAKT